MTHSVGFKDITSTALFNGIPERVKGIFAQSEYPWEVISLIHEYINNIELVDLTLYAEGIWIGRNTRISALATLNAPAIIGHGCEIRPGAYIRGNVIICDNCVIGNSTEIKNSVIMNNVQLPHYNYVGDSVIGNNSHLGAGVICSNLKSDKTPVIIKLDPPYETNMRKLGAIIGDSAEIGCNCVLNPGTIIGKNSRVYPLNSVRGVIAEKSIVKSGSIIVKADIE